MNREIARFLDGLPRRDLHALEVSGWAHAARGWASYRALEYPEFDLCAESPPSESADIVFCEQVIEHVPDPARAMRNLAAMLRPGGHLVLSVPFMVRVHNEPSDYWRFTPAGLRLLVERAGLELVSLGDWGNRAAVVANLWVWAPYVYLFQSLARDEAVPLVVWAVARRPATAEGAT